MTLMTHPPRRALGSVAVFVLSVLAACGPLSHTLEPDALPGVIEDYKAGRLDLSFDGDNSIRVDASRDPALRLHLAEGCSIWQTLGDSPCRDVLEVPLESAEMVGDTLTFEAQDREDPADPPTGGRAQIGLAELESVEVLVREYTADDWDHNWGLGVVLAGPSGFFGFDAQYFPIPEIVFDAGLFAAPHAGSAYFGGRMRPFRWGPVRPFFGGLVSFVFAAGETAEGEADSYRQGAYGPRLGLDIEFARGHGMVGLEGEYLRLIDRDDVWVGDIRGPWVPWGGVRLAALF
jgi:hypothetical protein